MMCEIPNGFLLKLSGPSETHSGGPCFYEMLDNGIMQSLQPWET